MRRVVFVTVIVAALVAGAVGCARPAEQRGAPAPTTATAAGTADRPAIYAAMLRRFLTSGDSSFPGRFPVVYVLDYAETTAPDNRSTTTEPISASDQATVLAALRDTDVGPVQFIPNREQVVDVIDRCAQVRDHGILITLGLLGEAPDAGANRVEVSISGFVACLGATWLTYVVERGQTGWQVTGTTGSVAVA